MTVTLELLISLLTIAGTAVTVVIFINKMRWELDQSEKTVNGLSEEIKAIHTKIAELRERGSIPTNNVEKRIDGIEKKLDVLQETVQKLLLKIGGKE